MATIIHQFNGKTTYEGQRIYLDRSILSEAGFEPGVKYATKTDPLRNIVEFQINNNGSNIVSKKKKRQTIVPVIDKAGSEIRQALESCDEIKVTLVKDRVIIEGIKRTATVKSSIRKESHFTSITFCAGAGVSTECVKQAGFKEVAAVEWNPKEGSEDKFSGIYSKNHPESVMFNLPMQMLKGNHLPYADVWVATLDCTDYSKASNGTKKEFHTMHLFVHLMRLFWERPKAERPLAIMLENVSEFEKIAGISLELCLKEEGFYVSRGKINSLDYGSRTKRERFFMVATIFEGYSFPKPTGKKETSIADDGVLSLQDLNWVTPEESGTLQYFISREEKGMTHNHHMTTFDITKDPYIGTITKSHYKIQPENWIKHPTEDRYAYLNGENIRALHNIRKDFYLGDSNKMVVESIGQSVCTHTFYFIAKKLFEFLEEKCKAYSIAS
ncbi:DNA cytosine methyltransferase (plasmid) [Paenibacillus thiaminolyticus]|uniref:DNA cytosine methyltransferase n=1 Tax=Paenibacillus thiaminolyticus TaxID=49283 RepID=UPI00232AA37B|nr:DNA cytosine methyltransferase [Paenibacillus thiaminolyticus]WCF11533.1 DNA cytosine methyltransferase [Paenibacillus thiaminolyticus]